MSNCCICTNCKLESATGDKINGWKKHLHSLCNKCADNKSLIEKAHVLQKKILKILL